MRSGAAVVSKTMQTYLKRFSISKKFNDQEFLKIFSELFFVNRRAFPLSWNTAVMCQSFRAISLVGAIGRGGKVEVNPTFKYARSGATRSDHC